MKNKEKFANDIVEAAIKNDMVSVDKQTGKILSCFGADCKKCLFFQPGSRPFTCRGMFSRWANSEYKEPTSREEILEGQKMNNDELKKDILSIVEGAMLEADELPFIETTEYIADALIAAGIGDVSELQKERESKEEAYNKCYFDYKYWKDKAKEYQHRAEVAERALRNAAPRLNCRGGLGKGFCRVDKCDYYHCNNDEGCVKAHLQQAEKELAEE